MRRLFILVALTSCSDEPTGRPATAETGTPGSGSDSAANTTSGTTSESGTTDPGCIDQFGDSSAPISIDPSVVGKADERSGSCGGVGTPEVHLGFTALDAGRYVLALEPVEASTVLYALAACDGPELGCAYGSLVLDLGAGESVVLVIDGAASKSRTLAATLVPSVEAICDDAVDDDFDGAIDCDDPDCDVATACADDDLDGLRTFEEAALGTDASEWDTDGDSLSDRAEANVLGTDPLTADGGACDWEARAIAPYVADDLAFADFDQDGIGDIAAAVTGGLQWLAGDGVGFVQAVDLAASFPGDDTDSVAVSDLDVDGDPDLLYTSEYYWQVVWVENLGGGSFSPAVILATTPDPVGVRAADLDGDGDDDVVYSSAHEVDAWAGAYWVQNLGGGQFRRAQWLGWGQLPHEPVDLDRDGDLDLLSADHQDGEATWIENLGNGRFAAVASLTAEGDGWALGARAADLEGDGDLDIVGALLDVYWFENVGALQFGGATIAGVTPGPFGVWTVAELHGDGRPQLLTGTPTVTRYTFDGGEFVGDPILAAAVDGVEAGDIDGDGDLDVFASDVITAAPDSLTEYVNRASDVDDDGMLEATEACVALTAPTSADSDLGGTADGEELFGGTDPHDPYDDAAPADTDADGLSDFRELAVFFSDPRAADTDADGLDDGTEVDALGTDPTASDTDGDTLEDAVEDALGSDPGDVDSDRDGVGDADEIALGTDLLAADSDGDGLDDFEEAMTLGTDPLTAGADTDADGLPDAAEVVRGTDPQRADTDGDGLLDGAESPVALDPLDWDTDGDELRDGGDAEPWADDSADCRWTAHAVAEAALPYQEDAGVPPRGLMPTDGDGDGDLDMAWLQLVDTGINEVWQLVVADNLGGAWGIPVVVDQWVGSESSLNVYADAGDIDGDGDGDFVVLWLGRFFTYKRETTGTYTKLQVVTGSAGQDIQLVDFEADGDLDVIAGRSDTKLYLNLGAGTFAAAVTVATSGNRAAPLDVDGDGDLDVIVNNGSLNLYENVGATFVKEAWTASAISTVVVHSADIDRDGDPDLVTGDLFSVLWYENLGNQAFGAPRVVTSFIDPEGFGVVGIDLQDVDDDGWLDVLAAYGSGLLQLARNRGGGVFEASRMPMAHAHAVRHADLDGDGDADPVVGTYTGVSWYTNAQTDADVDGWSEAAELCTAGTDPLLADSDGGGTGDAGEAFAGTDPLDSGDDAPPVDSDGDGLTDFAEHARYGTDPSLTDTDGDGLSDPAEGSLFPPTDPTNADTDGDGASDGEEVAAGTRPLDADTDDDGLTDGAEISSGADPYVADTDGDGMLDVDEVLLYGSEPTIADPDTDGDQLLDPLDAWLGLDPFDPDTDHDWLEDGDEVLVWVTDPLAPDSDLDGLLDGVETVYGEDPIVDSIGTCGWSAALVTLTSAADVVSTADLTEDGLPDLLITGNAGIVVSENLGDGTFAAGVVWLSRLDPDAEAVDLDGDGDLDLAYADSIIDTEIGWLENLGGGSFAAAAVIGNVSKKDPIVHTADIDGDGLVDIVVTHFNEPDARWARNLGGGVFDLPQDLFVGSLDLVDPKVVDIDLDGDPDVLAASGTAAIDWWENTSAAGSASFAAQAQLVATKVSPTTVDVGDLDGDGDPDLVVGHTPALGAEVHENLGGPQFATGEQLTAEKYYATVLADLGDDGLLDVIYLPSLTLQTVQVRHNRGGLEFGPSFAAVGVDVSLSLAAADLDLDGALDLVGTVDGKTQAYWNGRVDEDGDGLTSALEECVVGTDPSESDSDGGGSPDGVEVNGLQDPLDSSDDGP